MASSSSSATPSPPTLDEGAVCVIQLAAVKRDIRCVVVGFAGATVLLLTAERIAAADFRSDADLASGFLMPGDPHARWAQEGHLTFSPDFRQCLFVSKDGFFAVQRRAYSRAPISLPVTIAGPGQRRETVTLDVSAGGCRLPAPPPDVGEVHLSLQLPTRRADTPAAVVRRSERDVTYTFLRPDDEDRDAISAMVLSWHAQHLPSEAVALIARAHGSADQRSASPKTR
ncbi:PilZ domain-containing protein [Baekduia soli]|uniref:PilZ domain-containing protein n=1 Tax=Baekduia soli TaxID=496014 RepID=A0A5B8U6D0_9ACTN|nr:PilZ domain-containing protein [Baekduia soli]QEC48491.1 PilZ domain-containing protein [Baekduia soli]